MAKDELAWLESWYESHCDGDWEHSFGVQIDTLDNPGWQVVVDLEGTELDGQTMQPVIREPSTRDWVHCSTRDRQFRGYGGSTNLADILGVFRDWAEPSATTSQEGD